MKIRDVLAQKGDAVKTVSPSARLGFIAEVMMGLRIASIVIVDPLKRPQGVVTDTHIIWTLARRGANALMMTAADVMESPPPTCSPDDSVRDVMGKMTLRRMRHVLVIEGTRMVGIVSIGDLVKCHMRDTEMENRVLKDVAVARL